jgi:predicted amidohydrolase
MAQGLRVAVAQMNSRDDKAANLRRAEALIDEAAAQGARLVAFPEVFDYLGPNAVTDGIPEPIPGPLTERLAAKAREHGIYVHAGSVHEQSDVEGKCYNTTVLFDPNGEMIAKYRKIHLFDIDLTGHVSANESGTILPGNEVVTAEIDGHTVGLAICYDLRFPELFRLLAVAGAEVLFLPAAFTMFTGKDHWHVLLRARAIENQCYVLAPAQIGPHEPEGQCYGHSMIVDPWGVVLGEAPNREGLVVADLDFDALQGIRTQLPSLMNRRPSAYQPQPVGV